MWRLGAHFALARAPLPRPVDVQGVRDTAECGRALTTINPTPMHNTILGIDPGTREMGVVVVRGPKLVSYGVHTLRNGSRPHSVIGQARAIVRSYIDECHPNVVAIEKPLMKPTKRAALVSVIAQELRARSNELGLSVTEISPRRVREKLVGDRYATKIDVAQVLVERFPELHSRLPEKPKRSALGYRPRDKYWLHMFDALAVAVSVGRSDLLT